MKSPDEYDLKHLPGGDLVYQGIKDLEGNIESQESLLVSIAAPRLLRLGFSLPESAKAPKGQISFEHQLYDILEKKYDKRALSYYNSLIRRIISFVRVCSK